MFLQTMFQVDCERVHCKDFQCDTSWMCTYPEHGAQRPQTDQCLEQCWEVQFSSAIKSPKLGSSKWITTRTKYLMHTLNKHVHTNLLVLRRGGKFSQHGRNSSKLCGGEVHIGTLAKAVGKVAGRCGHHRGLVAYACLVPHAQRASRHLQSRPDLAEDTVIAFCGQLQ